MNDQTPVEALAADVEAERVHTAEDVETIRAELADLLESDRKDHNVRLEERLKEQLDVITKRTNHRLLALFLGMTLIFGLLAYRTEVNANALHQGFYDACVTRQARQLTANSKREEMAKTAANGPNAPEDPADKAALQQRIEDALLLPVEDCGEAP